MKKKYKFVFIASPKTGSTSIHKTLLNCVKDEDLINNSTTRTPTQKQNTNTIPNTTMTKLVKLLLKTTQKTSSISGINLGNNF